MRNTFTIVAALISVGGSWMAFGNPTSPTLFTNEQAIEFKANSGEKTDAVAGHFLVPENRANPESRKIRVNYVRFPATGDKKGPPIVYLSGGPGGSGIGTAKWRRFPLFMALREYGDVIALDQRGTGQSEQVPRCTSDHAVPLDKRANQAQVQAAYLSAARQCLSKWRADGTDVYGYTTIQNAQDINDLRVHLKAQKVSLWGISYGSHLAFAAMKQFPEYIDKVILASAEGLDQTVKLPAETDAYFAKLQTVINQQELRQQIPDLVGLMRRVHTKLDNTPISLAIPQKDGSNQQMLFQKEHLQMLASQMIADPNQYLAMLIQTYWGLDKGNTQMLEGILQRGIFTDEPISFRLMPLAMDVASGITQKRLTVVKSQAEQSLLGENLNFPMPLLNKVDTKLDLGDSFREEIVSDIPTLLFTGSLDGRTYPREQAEAIAGLTQAVHIEVTYAGHNLYTASPKVLERMLQFLADQRVDRSKIELPLPILSMPPRN